MLRSTQIMPLLKADKQLIQILTELNTFLVIGSHSLMNRGANQVPLPMKQFLRKTKGPNLIFYNKTPDLNFLDLSAIQSSNALHDTVGMVQAMACVAAIKNIQGIVFTVHYDLLHARASFFKLLAQLAALLKYDHHALQHCAFVITDVPANVTHADLDLLLKVAHDMQRKQLANDEIEEDKLWAAQEASNRSELEDYTNKYHALSQNILTSLFACHAIQSMRQAMLILKQESAVSQKDFKSLLHHLSAIDKQQLNAFAYAAQIFTHANQQLVQTLYADIADWHNPATVMHEKQAVLQQELEQLRSENQNLNRLVENLSAANRKLSKEMLKQNFLHIGLMDNIKLPTKEIIQLPMQPPYDLSYLRRFSILNNREILAPAHEAPANQERQIAKVKPALPRK